MKLFYPPKTKDIVRIRIYIEPSNAKYINLTDTTIDKALDFCENLITKQNISPFQSGRRVSIEAREYTDKKNGKSKSIAFKGLTTEATYNLILKELKQKSMLSKEDLKQYAVEMGQICSAYSIGQVSTEQFIKSASMLNDALSTLDNNNNQLDKETSTSTL